jgi:hypothetical protein
LKRRVPNLSFQGLTGLISDPSLKASVETATKIVIDKCEFARAWRNRRLAHSDLMTMRKSHPYPLPAAEKKKVEEALSAIHHLLDLVERHYGRSVASYSANPWAARELVHYLEVGVRTEEEKWERRRRLAENEMGDNKSA